jgi:hypothetical protein
MDNLKVNKVTTTQSGDSAGAMTLYCTVDGREIQVRTEVLKDASGNVVTAKYFEGKTIDVNGVIDYFLPNEASTGKYQIKIYSLDDVVVH